MECSSLSLVRFAIVSLAGWPLMTSSARGHSQSNDL